MLIGLHGCKQVGKDTIAAHLIENYDFTRLAFADKLKEAVANLFGLTVEQVDEFKRIGIDDLPIVEVFLSHLNSPTEWVFSWREFLQHFGTRMGRGTFGYDFWLDLLLPQDKRPSGNVVITDVRFENEARRILAQGGYVIEVTRSGYEPDGHVSEDRIHEDLIDALILNNGTLDDLYKDVDKLMKGLTDGYLNYR